MAMARREFIKQSTAADAMQWRAFGSRLLERNPAFISLSAA